MTVDTKEVVTTIAYMIGVRMSALTVSYGECSELIEKLQADKDATTIRYLCKLRTVPVSYTHLTLPTKQRV